MADPVWDRGIIVIFGDGELCGKRNGAVLGNE